jgi:pSer/pThr/pTyr-binding forkhead associated (FHA) protein
MCRSTIEQGSIPSDPGAPTIRATSSLPRERPSAIGLSETPFPEAANPKLPKGEQIRVFVVEGPSQGGEFEITRSITTIGRIGGGADVEIDDPEISRSHCAIEIRRDGILLYDLRSTNGTYLCNSGVSVVRLEPMSTFRIGTSLLQLKAT